MTRPRSVTAAVGLAALTAALTALPRTALDFAPTTVTAPPPPAPPAPPAGVSPEEWERVLTAASSDPDPGPMTNLELFSLLYDARLIAVAVTGIVLWLVVAVAAARGCGWARFVAVAVVGGQAVMLLMIEPGTAPAVYAVTAAVIVAGAISAALLFRPESIAYCETTSEPRVAAALDS